MHGGAGDTICALATAPGDAALGVLRLSGPAALALLRCVGRIGAPRPWRVQRVTLRDPDTDEVVDRALVTFMAAPRSYTGEDVVEISAHGGRLNMARLLALFVRLGARPAAPGEFTRRAFVNGRMDLAQAEAVLEVINARGERALRNAQIVLGGALGARVREMRAALVLVAADLEAWIDFGDEPDVDAQEDARVAAVRDALREVRVASAALQASYAQGQRLAGVAVALVGEVNAGKSCLFNALVGTTRAVVSSEAGTTRDYLECELQWEGLAVTLVDTAGRRDAGCCSGVERAGRALGEERVARCDVVVEVIDLAAAREDAVAPCDGGALRVIAANKTDLLSDAEIEMRCARLCARATGVPVVPVSALRGHGLPPLRAAVLAAALGTEPVALAEGAETLQITSARHAGALTQAEAALGAADRALQDGVAPELVVEHVRAALTALGEITGEAFTEEVLEAIFSRFCIGK
jgi:tRNA modification GTPase